MTLRAIAPASDNTCYGQKFQGCGTNQFVCSPAGYSSLEEACRNPTCQSCGVPNPGTCPLGIEYPSCTNIGGPTINGETTINGGVNGGTNGRTVVVQQRKGFLDRGGFIGAISLFLYYLLIWVGFSALFFYQLIGDAITRKDISGSKKVWTIVLTILFSPYMAIYRIHNLKKQQFGNF